MPVQEETLVHVRAAAVSSLLASIQLGVASHSLLLPFLSEATGLSQNVQECLKGLVKFATDPNLKVALFPLTCSKLKLVLEHLRTVRNDITTRKGTSQLHNIESISSRLMQMNNTLKQIHRHLTILRMLDQVLCGLAIDNKERIRYALNRALFFDASLNTVTYLFDEISNRCGTEYQTFGCHYPVLHIFSSAHRAVLSFCIGKSLFESAQGIVQDYQRAARYLQFAYRNELIASAFYLGDMCYNGKGIDQCYRSAFKYFLIGANNGDANAMGEVANCYFYGLGTNLSLEMNHKYNRLAANAGSAVGMRNLGYSLLYGTMGYQNWSEAKRLLERAQLRGNFRANFELSRCYEHGIGVERDEAVAFELINEAYKNRVPDSMYHLGRCYEEGIGTERDLQKAAELYRENVSGGATSFRERRAMYGMCLVRGRGVQQDIRLGMKLIHKGLMAYDATGWYILGKCYQNGYGVDRDVAKAVMCFSRGASATNGTRQIMECHVALAEIYETGKGFQKNMNKAVYHYGCAAARIHTASQLKMGLFYESGTKVGKNVYRAFDFLDKAARGGHTLAMRKAAVYYMKGIGIPRNRSYGKLLLHEAIKRENYTAERIVPVKAS